MVLDKAAVPAMKAGAAAAAPPPAAGRRSTRLQKLDRGAGDNASFQQVELRHIAMTSSSVSCAGCDTREIKWRQRRCGRDHGTEEVQQLQLLDHASHAMKLGGFGNAHESST